MCKANNIMFKPELIKRIEAQLREKSEDVYLLVRLLVETGCIAGPVSRSTVNEMKIFISKNESILNDNLVDELFKHMEFIEGEDYYFTGHRSKDHKRPISKRSYETLIKNVGNRFGISDLNVKTLSRTYFYDYFRKTGFDFAALKRMMKNRGRNIKDLASFLDLCGITFEEYHTECKRYLEPDIAELQQALDCVVEELRQRRERFANGTYIYTDVADTVRIIDTIS